MGGLDRSGRLVAVHSGLSALLAVALLAGLVAGHSSSDPASASADAQAAPAPELPPASTEVPTTTTTTTSTSTTTTTTTVPDLPPGFTAEPVDDGGAESAPYGWGTAQPNQMRATVHYGGTERRLSPERRALLGLQLAEAREAGLAIGTVAEAERQGFVKNFRRVDGRGFDYINWDRFTPELDLSRPSLLLFEDDEPDSRIISVAYNVTGPVQDGPPDDLPLEVIGWHYHSNLCQGENTMIGSVEFDEDGNPYQEQIERCQELGATFRPDLSHWMVDLWVIPGWENPWGLISSYHPDQYERPRPWFRDPPATAAPAATGTTGAGVTDVVATGEYCALHTLVESSAT